MDIYQHILFWVSFNFFTNVGLILALAIRFSIFEKEIESMRTNIEIIKSILEKDDKK